MTAMISACDAIERLIFRYAALLDDGRFDEVGELLANATLIVRHDEVMLAKATGKEEVTALLRLAHVDAHGSPGTHHVTTNVRVAADRSAGVVCARSYVTLFQSASGFPLQPVACGVYHDQFECVADAWRFVERINELRLVGDLGHRLGVRAGMAAPGLASFVRGDAST